MTMRTNAAHVPLDIQFLSFIITSHMYVSAQYCPMSVYVYLTVLHILTGYAHTCAYTAFCMSSLAECIINGTGYAEGEGVPSSDPCEEW